MANIGMWMYQDGWPADAASVRKAREFVSGHLLENDLAGLCDDARLVVSELVTNVVRHVGTAFTVTLERHNGSVVLSVHDSLAEPPTPSPEGRRGTSGHGLLLVEACSGSWGVSQETTGKSVWATFDVPAPVLPV